MSILLPLGFATVVWYTATGVILVLNRRPTHTFGRSLAAATAILAVSLGALYSAPSHAAVRDAYIGFGATIAVWGWIEMAFLMGFITGPQRHGCPSGCRGLPHLGHAIKAILYHEFAIIAGGIAVYALTRGQANPVAWHTFLILWIMRESAKLNLFLGVPNVGEDYLPEHMRYLATLFRRQPMNLLFPLSVTLGTLGCAYYAHAIVTDTNAAAATADTLLATLTGLGLLEHWFMVLPVRTERLWRWSLTHSGRHVRVAASDIGPTSARRATAALTVQGPA